MSKLYSIIDIETTGGSARNERIIEIAIIVTDGKEIIDQFSSLIYPEKRIPPFIVGLTGITNEMLEDAPKFYEIAAKIVETTKNTVFVAHNVNFDYSFLKHEFQCLGYNFSLNNLCTLSLSRKLIKGLKSYSLGNICEDLNITIKDRHRASGDAMATYELFKILLTIDNDKYNSINITGFPLKGLNPNLNISILDTIPQTCGVYYFYDDNDNLIYIGKSKNIRTRILSHLRNEKTTKEINLRASISNISYEETGCELIALLKESDEIKKNRPKFNVSQRRTIYNWGIYFEQDEKEYLRLKIDKTDSNEKICLRSFNSNRAAREALFNLCNEYNLCQKLCDLYKSAGACFGYGLGECKGACCEKEKPEEYNIRVQKLIDRFSLIHDNAMIVFEDHINSKLHIVALKDGKYKGFGMIDSNAVKSIEDLSDCIKNYSDNKDVRQIISTYLRTKNDYKIIKL